MGLTAEEGAVDTFEFEGFSIPVDLAILTGGGEDTWEGISLAHMAAYGRYSPIWPGQHVLEVGCGVGRDAIPLAKALGPEGSYLGVDIIRPSIDWCRDNITPRYPNAVFDHFDIQSAFYNPTGAATAAEIRFPIEDGCIDRVILQSVFTHMFEDDIVHFLSEFRRILRPDGLVFASFFILDEESLRLTTDRGQGLTFQHPRGGGCWITELENPEGAVGYTPEAFQRLLRRSGMALVQPVHHGSWCGRQGVPDGQDIAILGRISTPEPLWKRFLRGRAGRRSRSR